MGASKLAPNQNLYREIFHVGIELTKGKPSHNQPEQSEVVAAQPVEILVSAIFAHEQHDDAAAVERRRGQQVERAEEQIQGEENKKHDAGKIPPAAGRIAADPMHRRAEAE